MFLTFSTLWITERLHGAVSGKGHAVIVQHRNDFCLAVPCWPRSAESRHNLEPIQSKPTPHSKEPLHNGIG